jgi:FkbH-like protein
MIKLIIWDLDGILWSGPDSLAETEQIGALNQPVVNFIKKSESVGIVHSVCSKNDTALAKKTLIKLGIFQYFVFPKMEFSPKGPLIKSIISDCQLRPENVLFVDDNDYNLAEAKYYSPGLNVSIDTSFINSFELPNGKSRTDQYRILEQKHADKSNINFLKDSDIHIAFWRSPNLIFYNRVFELVNRSNQLNFTNSRIEPEKQTDLMPYVKYRNNDNNILVFVWDKYGYYGLVGYIHYDDTKVLDFVFSCRIMNMTVENFCSHYIKNNLGCEQNYTKPIKNDGDYSYITLHDYVNNDFDYTNFIREKENLPKKLDKPLIYINVGVCQNDILDSLLNLSEMTTCQSSNVIIDNIPLLIIHILALNETNLSTDLESLIQHVIKTNRKMLLLFPKQPKINDESLKYKDYVDDKNIYRLDMECIDENGYPLTDYLHWPRHIWVETAEKIRDWALFNLTSS